MDESDQKTPGPGYYNVEKETIAYRNIEKLTNGMFSSIFQRPPDPNQNPSSRANKAVFIPGPGTYDVKLFEFNNEKKAVGSSMFKSDSVRELASLPRGPGPAFYKSPSQ